MDMDYTKHAVNYDEVSRIYDSSRTAHAEVTEKLIQAMRVDRNSIILDMGCGTGNYTTAVQPAVKNVIGIDLSPGMLGQARSKSPLLPLVHGDITNLPFRSETFDGVYAVQVLHHVKNKNKYLKETHRILKKGAYLAIDSCSHQQMRTFWIYHYFPRGLEIDLTRISDTGTIANMLDAAGFSNVEVEISYTDVIQEHEKPERYLDRDYLNGQSTFHYLLAEVDIDAGCDRLREDIASGAVEGIIRQYEVKELLVGGSCIIYGRK